MLLVIVKKGGTEAHARGTPGTTCGLKTPEILLANEWSLEIEPIVSTSHLDLVS